MKTKTQHTKPCLITNNFPRPLGLLHLGLLFGMMVLMPFRGWGQVTDGMYYIKVSSTQEVYLWRAITEKTDGQPYLSGWPSTTFHAVFNNVTYGGVTYNGTYDYNAAHCSWIVKQVTVNNKTYYYLINVGTNQYVVWDRYDSSGARAVHLESRGSEPTLSDDHCFYTFYHENDDVYKIHPDQCTVDDRGLNYKGDYNANDKLRVRDANGRGLIQFYDGTKNRIVPADLLVAPTISEVDPSTNTVTVSDNNSLPLGYNIRYTTDGSDPDANTPNILSPGQSYYVTSACTMKAVVERYGIVLTHMASKDLAPVAPDAPVFTVNCDNTLSISTSVSTASIRYTTDGTVPSVTEGTLYEGPFTVNLGAMVKAIAYQNSLCSNVSTLDHFVKGYADLPDVVLSGTTATITPATGTKVYYTTNGSDPTTSSPSCTSATDVTISETGPVDLRYIAMADGLSNSCVGWAGRPAIVSGDCSNDAPRGNVMTLTGPDGLSYWYSVTGENGPYTEYTLGGEVVLDDLVPGANANGTVYVYAKTTFGTELSVSSTVHPMKTKGKPVLTPPVGSSPVVLISGGVYGDVAICSASGVATQSIPLEFDGTAEYTITPEASGTLTVVFKHGEWQPSCQATYVLPAAPATPTWSQSCDNLLSLHCETPMADIHYEIGDEQGGEAAEPTLASPTYVTGCLDHLVPGQKLHAKAFLGFRASEELSYTYSLTHCPEPQFFVEGTQVTISVPGADNYTNVRIYYNLSTDGTEPPEATTSSTPYEGAYTLTGITIFSAIAIADGLEASCPVRAVTRIGYSIHTVSDLSKLSTYPDKYFFVYEDIDASSYTTIVPNFTGVVEGNMHKISGLTKPLFGTATGAVIHDLMLDNVAINVEDGNAGAIAQAANGATRIYNCGILSTGSTQSSVIGTDTVGGLVGSLYGSARVINCFSYADIEGGNFKAGIVGYNKVASTSGNLQTMVMNCLFYGDISDGGTIAPVYGGELIHNKRASNANTGLNNYCFFLYKDQDYLGRIDSYDIAHGSLGAEERFLNRFEFFRMTLNSTRSLAAFYVTGYATEVDLMAKWVLDKSIAPYPILKAPGYYPSIINHDAEHASPIDPDNVHINEGRKLGTLTVNVQMGSGGPVFSKPEGASISQSSISLVVTDKDFDHDSYVSGNYDYNYKKVQLPYYSEVGEGNYTKASDGTGRVVTGWKITAINGSTSGTGTFTTDTYDYPSWNFVDRTCTNKDLYSVSHRVFNQGAYWEVPDGVTSITIEPYWAKSVFLSDANYDVTYSGTNKYPVTVAGDCPMSLNEQTVYDKFAKALTELDSDAGGTVYDYAVVLVGNYHHYFGGTSPTSIEGLDYTENCKPFTIMSADIDGDKEPDNCFFYAHEAQQLMSPFRFDFICIPGIGAVKRTWNSGENPHPGIIYPRGWTEITNTTIIRFGQFEYGQSADDYKKIVSPCILQGGAYDQIVSTRDNVSNTTNYILLGGNAWFKEFNNGCHTRKDCKTKMTPVNVAGGEYQKFYLSGVYRPQVVPYANDSAECYIDGGYFVEEMAGAGMQKISGSVTWLINGADIGYFYGGGINGGNPISGNVTTTISNSRVTEFYGGPKFGDMASGKKVKSNATNCRFNLFYGAGYGGTSLYRLGCEDATLADNLNTATWSTYRAEHYKRQYEATHLIHAGGNQNVSVNAISTSYDYEYILMTDGKKTVARFYVNFASMSLASTRDVTSTLTDCKLGTFYGGGRMGAVKGNVLSTLTNCVVEHDVFGSGYTADPPTVEVFPAGVDMSPAPVYNRAAGVFNTDQVGMPTAVTYTWSNTHGSNDAPFTDDGDNHYIFTSESLTGLGAVLGNATLTLDGTTTVAGNVYGGGEESGVMGNTTVNLKGGVTVHGNVYGGGNRGAVSGNSQVIIQE